MKQIIREWARELGFDDCRVTNADPPQSANQFVAWIARSWHGEMGYLARNGDKRSDPRKVLAEAKSVVVLATSYAPTHPAMPCGASSSSARVPLPGSLTGVVARYARFTDYHHVLKEKLVELAKRIDQLGGPGTRSLWYVDTGPILERDLAQRAGVGFVGKHTNLIGRRLGNWIFLSEILTTLELPSDESERNRCGSCARCLAACPTQAIRAPYQLDSRLCISYLTIELKGAIPEELRPAIGNRIFGCDDCLAICPWNRFAREGALMKNSAQPRLAAPDLLEFLGLDETAFRQRFRDTPIWRIRRRGLLRNVCVALGNAGDASVLPALRKAAEDIEPLIAEHARWAIDRILTRGT